MRRGWGRFVVVVVALALAVVACGGDDDDDDAGGTGDGGEIEAIRVPQDAATIQEAVDDAEDGDLILIDEGVYREAVDVTTPDITIRGVDRNTVVLDGGFELENGIRVLDTDGVVVENMTARNYVGNGFFWTGSDYYRGSYLTAYRNGGYGIYAFDAYHGQLDHSYASGSSDGGFYIGECFKCDAVIDSVVSSTTASDTRAPTQVAICTSSTRSSPTTVSGSCRVRGRTSSAIPNRERRSRAISCTTTTTRPRGIESRCAQGNGILMSGGVRGTIERTGCGTTTAPASGWCRSRRGRERPRTAPVRVGHAVRRNPERTGSRDPRPTARRSKGCAGCAVLWHPFENRVVGNVVETSGVADLAVGTADLFGTGETTDTLGNCFSDNTFTTSAPRSRTLAPCDGTGQRRLERRGARSPRPSRPARGRATERHVPDHTGATRAGEHARHAHEAGRAIRRPGSTRHRGNRGSRQTCRLSAREPSDCCGRAPDCRRVGRGACRLDTRVGRAEPGRSRVGPGAPPRGAGPCRTVRGEVCVQPLGAGRPDRALRSSRPVPSARFLWRGGRRASSTADVLTGRTRRATSVPIPRRTGTRRCTTGTRSSSRTHLSRTTAPRRVSLRRMSRCFRPGWQ